ncbi:hypothetical protein, partial [Brevundimonas naejangsanensis]
VREQDLDDTSHLRSASWLNCEGRDRVKVTEVEDQRHDPVGGGGPVKAEQDDVVIAGGISFSTEHSSQAVAFARKTAPLGASS